MALDNATTLWKYRLQYKFANSRRRDDHEVQIVIRHKRKGNKILPVSHISKAQPPQSGIANYQPSRPSSEDDASIKAHILWMQQETSKRKPNCERIKLAMSMTLSDRRQLINKEGASVLKIQQTYPWLFDEEEMQNEFQRLTGGRESPRDLLQAGLQKYEDQIITIFKTQKKTVPYVEEALKAIGLQREETSRRETACIAAALAVPILLKEQVDDVIIFGDDIGKGFAVIQGDGDKLSSCETFNFIIDGIADIINIPAHVREMDPTVRPQLFVLVRQSGDSKLNPTSVFLIIEKKSLAQKSLLLAVDACYKPNFVIDCKFHEKCKGVWYFSETSIFNTRNQEAERTPQQCGI